MSWSLWIVTNVLLLVGAALVGRSNHIPEGAGGFEWLIGEEGMVVCTLIILGLMACVYLPY